MVKVLRNLLRSSAVPVVALALVLGVSGAYAATTIGSNITTAGTLTVSGNTTLGDASTDTVTFYGKALTGPSAVVSQDLAAGGSMMKFQYKAITTALTGDFEGMHVRASTDIGSAANAVNGGQFKAVANDVASQLTVATLRGVYTSVDAKDNLVTTARAFEASLDGMAGGTVTEATGVEVMNNTSGAQTAAYGISLNGGTASGHAAFTRDIRLQNGEFIDNASNGVVAITSPSTTFSGDITITGDDLVMTTNTSGAVLVADGTNFNPVVMSGDATISTAGVLAIASNAVAGTDISLASEAAGDIMYANGTDWVRLAKGTALQVLRTNAGATAPEWATMVAALDNASAWTALQNLDAGIAVDTTNFTVSGTTGAVHTAGDFDVATNKFAVAAATGVITLANGETIGNSTDGLVSVGGDFLVTPVRRAAVTADTNLVDVSGGNFLSGTTGRTFVLNVSATRPDGSQFTGGGDDAGLKVSVTNKNTTAQNSYVLRGLNVGATNRLGGTLGTIQGGLISVTQKGDSDSPVVTEMTGLQVTLEQDSPNTTIPTSMYGLKVRYDAVMAAPTNSAGIYVYNDSDTGLTDATAALWVGTSAADRDWKYALYIDDTAASVADIRLQNGEVISNATDGTISFGAANLTTTGALIMPTSAETLADGADGGSSCSAANKGAVVIDVANLFYGCDGTNWSKLSN